MSRLAADRGAIALLGTGFALAALTVLAAAWAAGGEAVEQWFRARLVLVPALGAALAAAACLRGAWRRRDAAASAVPLVGAALTALAAATAALLGWV